MEFGTISTLSDELNKDLQQSARHFFNIGHQYKTLRFLRENLDEGEIMIHMDFSENYSCKYQKEIQSVHFGASQKQISLHTGVAYTKVATIPFATVSDNLKHGPPAIWAHLAVILNYLKETTAVDIVHFVSDGPTTQYRSRSNLYLFAVKVFEYGFRKATWNFLEAGHGKGAPDGIGGALKGQADSLVVVQRKDITCAKDLVEGLNALQTSIKLFIVADDMIEKEANELPKNIESVPETMRIHQVLIN